MSNNHSATLGAAPMASPARASNTQASFWRRLFDAWVQSHASRIDPNGNVMCEL